MRSHRKLNEVAINQYFADAQNSYLHKKEKPATPDFINVCDVKSQYHPRICRLLWKREAKWKGRLRNPKFALHVIDMKDGAKPFISARYRSGTAACQPKCFELKMQVKASAVKPALSEWAATVLFVSKTMVDYASALIIVRITNIRRSAVYSSLAYIIS